MKTILRHESKAGNRIVRSRQQTKLHRQPPEEELSVSILMTRPDISIADGLIIGDETISECCANWGAVLRMGRSEVDHLPSYASHLHTKT